MKVPVVHGIIRRRLLVNFRCEPEAIQAQLPARFRPKLHQGHAIAGICLIRLEAIRPHGLPALLGLSSENAAHRIAVTWETDDGQAQEGVYIPRRDTGSLLNHLAGGRVFPGEHHRAAFQIEEDSARIALAMQSADGEVAVRVKGRFGGDLPAGSCFRSMAEVSGFFERGALGYSATKTPGRLDGLTLHTRAWRVEALQAEDVYSTFFADTRHFPAGTATFDCALAMRNIEHEWRSADDLHV